ncbi:MAG: helix-turn-helix domain-containing protein [Clostridia bacterium]|nr:helix-turn-helix domain-containing protein [Clostridia bacterium]
MNQYVTGAIIRQLREQKGLTQESLAAQLHVSSKAVSKWETGQGLPDISLLEPLAKALDISMIELFAGRNIVNKNRSSNLLRSVCYVCPVCGNGILALGQAVVSCCGITLPPLQSEHADEEHPISISVSDGEYYVSIDHPMSKDHYISCIFAISDNGLQYVQLYPESFAEARFRISNVRWIYAYCNRHGMFHAAAKGAKR